MRYSTPFVRAIWSDAETINLWTRVELAVLEAQFRSGLIPVTWWQQNTNHDRPLVQDWKRWEDQTEHEVVAFLYAWDPPHPVHIGVTSSDIVDTANALRFKSWRDEFRSVANELTGTLFQWVTGLDYQILTRTHGQPALVESASDVWMHELAVLERVIRHGFGGNNAMATMKISGPVGINGHKSVSADVERLVADSLGLKIDHNPSQVVSRDVYGRWAFSMAQVVTAIEAWAIQLRLRGLTDEYFESRPDLSVGSSSMPKKSNPINLERLSGLGRMARAMVDPINEGMLMWHQRDLAQSSVERTMLPQLMGLTHYALQTALSVFPNVVENPDAIAMHKYQDVSDDAYQQMADAMLGGMTYKEARGKFA